MEDLYHVTSELLPSLAEPGWIQGSETFVVMEAHHRWLDVLRGVWEEVADPQVRSKGARDRSAGKHEGGASPAFATGEKER